MSTTKRIPVRFTATASEPDAERGTRALIKWYMDLLRDAESQERARCQRLSLVR